MAYTPIRIVTVGNNRLTESMDLTVSVRSLIKTHSYLIVSQVQNQFALDLRQIFLFERGLNLDAPVNTAFSAVLSDLFVAKYGADAIPVKNARGVYDKRLLVFNPISYKNYKVQFTSVNTPTVRDDIKKKGFLDDLVISSKDDLSNCLVAVNGVFHKTLMFQKQLYVLDGFRTVRLTNRKDVTIVNTARLGGHSVIPITPSNTTLDQYNGLATINAGTSLINKTVFLVIDGYFYHLDAKAFYFGDSKTLKVRTNKLPLMQQLRHNPRTVIRQDLYSQEASPYSRKYTDPYDTTFLNKRSVPASVFQNKEFQLSRLTAFHSFLVVVNNPSVFMTSMEVSPTGTLQQYTDLSNQLVSGMASYGVGLCPSYLILKDPNKRKIIYLPEQDYDVDWMTQSFNPQFIPARFPDLKNGVNIPLRFFDYVSA